MKILARLVGAVILAVFITLLVIRPLEWIIIGSEKDSLYSKFDSFASDFFDYFQGKFDI